MTEYQKNTMVTDKGIGESSTFKRIFWNQDEHRIRSGWRLLIQFFGQFIVFISIYQVGVMLLGPLAGGSAATPEMAALGISHVFVYSLGTIVSILSVWVLGRFIDHRPFVDFGWHFDRSWWLDFIFGLLLGAVLMTSIFLAEISFGWLEITDLFHVSVPGWSFGVAILVPVYLFILIGIQEEIVVRGYQIHNLAEGLNLPHLGRRGAVLLAIAITAGWFGLNHAANPNATVVSTLNIALAGVMLGLSYVLTGELALPIGLHITWNLFQGSVFGFPVSGIVFSETTVLASTQSGPALWTGGAFGPEAGLAGTSAFLAGIVFIAIWVRLRRGSISFVRRLTD